MKYNWFVFSPLLVFKSSVLGKKGAKGLLVVSCQQMLMMNGNYWVLPNFAPAEDYPIFYRHFVNSFTLFVLNKISHFLFEFYHVYNVVNWDIFINKPSELFVTQIKRTLYSSWIRLMKALILVQNKKISTFVNLGICCD